jgi:hypothetical protein
MKGKGGILLHGKRAGGNDVDVKQTRSESGLSGFLLPRIFAHGAAKTLGEANVCHVNALPHFSHPYYDWKVAEF